MKAPLLCAAAALGLWLGCSFFTATGFEECTGPGDCGGVRVCLQGYCVLPTVPEGCSGSAAAGTEATYGQPSQANALRFGAAYNLTGPGGQVNTGRVQHLNALVLAVQEINQRGIAGRQLALHVCDTGGDDALLAEQLAYLAGEVGAPAILVPASGPVLSAAAVTVPRGVLLMSPTATSTEISALPDSPDGGPGLVWRTAPSDAIQAEVILDLLLARGAYDAGTSEAAQVGVLYLNDPYGQGLSAALLSGLLGTAKMVRSVQYEPGGEPGPAVALLDEFAPDLSVLIGFPEDVGRIVTAAEDAGNLSAASGHRWLLTDAAKDPGILTLSPPGALEGALGTAPAQGVGTTYGIFQSSFLSNFGVDPSSYAFMAHNYDALYVLALAAAHAVGPDGQQEVTGRRLAEGLTRLSEGEVFELLPSDFTGAAAALQAGGSIDVEGASGSLQFDPLVGEAPSPIELWEVSGGSLRTVTVLEPAGAL